MEKVMKLSAIVLASVLLTSAAQAQSLLETRDEDRMRHNAPLGGYNERLGNPAPYGTDKPGYVPSQGYDSYPSASSGHNAGNSYSHSGHNSYGRAY